MGRWVAKNFVDKGHCVWIMDNLLNCTQKNIREFRNKLAGFVIGDIKDKDALSAVFKKNFDICIHLAAAINVQESINNPQSCFDNNVIGAFNVLEECRVRKTKVIFISSALIYETAIPCESIGEDHPLKPSCPYAASKISGENLALSYYIAYNLPVVILRPFSIYGPWQRSDSEGGVMSIFINNMLAGRPLEVFGDGDQGRDFFYVEDCAEFIARAALSNKAIGKVLNAGSGQEIRIKDLAKKIAGKKAKIIFIKHHHPKAEIMHMRADSSRARRILGWKANTGLDEGIKRTKDWLRSQFQHTDVAAMQARG